jgi:hypothetical protein
MSTSLGISRLHRTSLSLLSLVAPGKKSNETSYYCIECSEDDKRMYLCTVIRAAQGNTKTCFDIWHQDWKCKVPTTAGTTIQLRPTTGSRRTGSRKRRCALQMREDSDNSDDEEQKGDD